MPQLTCAERHNPSAFVGAAALRTNAWCLEPQWGEAQYKRLPGYPVYPDACVQAFAGLPYLLIWRLIRDE